MEEHRENEEVDEVNMEEEGENKGKGEEKEEEGEKEGEEVADREYEGDEASTKMKNDQSEGAKPGKRSREKQSTAQRKKAKKEVNTFNLIFVQLRNSMQFSSRSELHQVSNMFETAAISWRSNRRWLTRAILKLQFRAQQKLHPVARQKSPVYYTLT